MLVKKLLPIVFLLGCSKTLDSGDDEAILDTPDGEWNLDFQWPDSRVRMYGTPEFPFGQFGLNEQGKVVPDPETQREWVPFLPSTPPLPAYPFDFSQLHDYCQRNDIFYTIFPAINNSRRIHVYAQDKDHNNSRSIGITLEGTFAAALILLRNHDAS